MNAILFPGQGSQFVGMAKDHFDSSNDVKKLFLSADEQLGYAITEIMFEGPSETLMQTRYTQPAIFLHSVALFYEMNIIPDAVAGHSLGELSALVAAKVLSFETALDLVQLRGDLMQEAGEIHPGTMAAIIGMDDAVVDDICAEASEEINKPVVAANYNCPGQLVISGDEDAVSKAVDIAKERGCRLAKMLPVSGAFHSPLMKPALDGFKKKVDNIEFNDPVCPFYSNATAEPTRKSDVVKENLIAQLTSPVRWTQTLLNMESNGITDFTEVGPGKVLQGLVKRTVSNANITGHQ
ncbi:[acyl-carrier-protein] S-malonyltransferase [Rhodohalobacter sp. SW132]|uniref:ACP S-malonyltransferase n=1 Tax=Rhodohalobacter sp. SW132 TaxID=2293433 RepID=UPI000E27A871|nr:ACP S-malonyltransferase [Rhodohalobacter sp. SW132]REL33668.1 [acyl-carrier-protein] S-malonyltransferase [Rhodohalobacter sp. SW132]